ncbi:MAG: ATP-binding protein [Burkholderiales bacterium]
MKTLRIVLIVAGVLLLAGALGFLYFKTEAVDFKRQNAVLGTLREIKDVDNKWDIEVLRLRLEPGAISPTAKITGLQLARAQSALTTAAAELSSPALAAGVPQLTAALTEKAKLVDQYRALSTAAKAALDEALKAAPAAVEAPRKDAKSNPPARADIADLAQRFFSAPGDELRAAFEKEAKAGGDATEAAATALIQARTAEDELFRKVSFLSAGPRVDTLTNAFNGELEATLEDKERWRVYLIYFAGALLILLGYLGQRLMHSYRVLDRRVEERTHELSETLKQLKESESQLIQSEKMSSLGQMVAGVVHEINTPLAYVKNSLGTVQTSLPEIAQTISETEKLMQVLASGTASEQELSAQFATAQGHMEQLKTQRVLPEMTALVGDGLYGIGQISDLVVNLKDFSRLDRSKTQSFDLNEGLNSTLMLARHLLKKITIRKEFDTLPAIVCSPSQINQVFLNLITNAAQAMERPDGTITITSRVVDPLHVAVDIADNGKGIPPDVLPKIFDPFFSTKGPGQGTGLGLSISYKIITEHGGKIDVQSTADTGTRFTVTLPLEPPPAPADLAADIAPAAPAPTKGD